jgi:hypothetical protein
VTSCFLCVAESAAVGCHSPASSGAESKVRGFCLDVVGFTPLGMLLGSSQVPHSSPTAAACLMMP